MCILFFMKMNVGVRITVMLVPVYVNATLSAKSQVKHPSAQKNNHQGHSKLKGVGEAPRNSYFEHDDQDAGDKQRNRMTNSPKRADKSGPED